MLMLRNDPTLLAAVWNDGFSASLRLVGIVLMAPVEAVRRWYLSARLREHLMRMSDRQLADVGIGRDEIPALARRAYRPAAAVAAPALVALAAAEAHGRLANSEPANDDARAELAA